MDIIMYVLMGLGILAMGLQVDGIAEAVKEIEEVAENG